MGSRSTKATESEAKNQTEVKDAEGKGRTGRRRSVIDEYAELERFKSFNKIEEVAGGKDVRTLTLKQKEELWDYYDKDKNGELSLDELKTVMRHLMRFRAKHATEGERKSIELRAMIMTPYSKEDFDEIHLAKMVFDSLDINHDGHVKKKEFIDNFTLDHETCRVQ